MRIEPAVGIYAGVEQQAYVVRVSENLIDEAPTEFAEFFLAFRIPEQILTALADRNVGVHSVPVDTYDGLRQEAGGEVHLGGDLTTDQFVELDLVGSSDDFAVAIVNFKLRRRNLRVILFILEPH